MTLHKETASARETLGPRGVIKPQKAGPPVKVPGGGKSLTELEELPGFEGGASVPGLDQLFDETGTVTK